MYFTSGSNRAFESLMQGKPGFDHYDSGDAGAPEDCGDCRFYRPDWKYQFCVYAECPYQPGKLTAYGVDFINNTKVEPDPNAKPDPTEITVEEKRSKQGRMILLGSISIIVTHRQRKG